MGYAFIATGIVAAIILTAFIRSRTKASRAKGPVFVCDHCGEHHCECHLKESDKNPAPQRPAR